MDSEEVVETGTVNTSRANRESTGYVNLCSCHQVIKLKLSSLLVARVSLSRYIANSDLVDVTGELNVGACDEVVDDEDEVPEPKIFPQAVFFLPNEAGAGGGRCKRTAPYFASYLT